ncbi:hypothetical protein BDZ97DRAFT_1826823 [Flammula alnicola]|nr:hypothetical protein BDZ97DRAFT_1826823 [Flammula alnicola]
MVTALFLGAAIIAVVVAQEQVLVYVPFEWDKVPGSTTFALIDGPETGIATPGPATVIQGPSIASMYYVNEADTVQPTLSGVCNLISPVAVCTLSVWTSTTMDTSDIGSSSGAAGGSSTGTMISMTTIALGFCIALALLK